MRYHAGDLLQRVVRSMLNDERHSDVKIVAENAGKVFWFFFGCHTVAPGHTHAVLFFFVFGDSCSLTDALTLVPHCAATPK